MGREDTSGCCNGPNGRHLPGCDRNRQKQKFNASQDRVNTDMREKARKYVDKHRNTRFTTYAPAGTNGMPPGVHMEAVEYKGEKHYKIVLD